MSLEDSVCLITGATRGLGARIAQAYWDLGAHLILVARHNESLSMIREKLGPRPSQELMLLEADLSAADSADRIVSQARKRFQKLDVLVNNAAIQGPIGPAWQNNWAEWMSMFQVNFFSPVKLCTLAVPWMAERQSGRIINLSGGGAVGPRPNFSAYGSAKSALVRFSETLATEVREMGISVNCVAPGAMESEMTRAIINSGPVASGQKEYDQALKACRTDNVAVEKATLLCVFLASMASQKISGKLISALWDPWASLPKHIEELMGSDVYTQRRILPEDRGFAWEKSND